MDINEAVYSYELMESELLEQIYQQFPYDEQVEDNEIWYRSKLITATMLARKFLNITKATKTSDKSVESYIRANTWGDIFKAEKGYNIGYKQGILQVKPTAPSNSLELNRIYKNKTDDILTKVNLTRTKALESANKEYLKIVNQAYIDMKAGKSYQQATREATTKLAKKGITGQTYISANGRVTNARVQDAVRRQLITSTSQLSGEMQLQRNEEWGNNHVEVDSHMGARPEHAVWQGNVFSVNGSTFGYRNLAEVTGYGIVTGLKGANCAHGMYPFIVGVSKQTYQSYSLEENEKQYELIQGQRKQEYSIRRQKEVLMRDDSTGDIKAFAKHSKMLKAKEKQLNQYKKDNNLTATSRVGVVGFNKSISQKAVNAG